MGSLLITKHVSYVVVVCLILLYGTHSDRGKKYKMSSRAKCRYAVARCLYSGYHVCYGTSNKVRCYRQWQLCNGRSDCPLGDDEMGCPRSTPTVTHYDENPTPTTWTTWTTWTTTTTTSGSGTTTYTNCGSTTYYSATTYTYCSDTVTQTECTATITTGGGSASETTTTTTTSTTTTSITVTSTSTTTLTPTVVITSSESTNTQTTTTLSFSTFIAIDASDTVGAGTTFCTGTAVGSGATAAFDDAVLLLPTSAVVSLTATVSISCTPTTLYP